MLNEAMAVVLLGEPIPRAKADRVKMLGRCGAPRLTVFDDALATTEGTKERVIECEQEWVLLCRDSPSAWCSLILGVATVVLCLAG